MPADNGGPAFPSDPAFFGDKSGPGLSIRDYFAGHALAGMLAGGAHWLSQIQSQSHDGTASDEEYAQTAYEIADAMLAAREVDPDAR